MPTLCQSQTGRQWVSVSEAARILGVGRRAVTRAIEAGAISLLVLPGSSMRLSRVDVERLAKECVRPAELVAAD